MTADATATDPDAAQAHLALAPDPTPSDALRIVRIGDIVDAVSSYIDEPDLDLIYKAYVYSARVHQGHQRANGEPYLNHPLWVAWLLTTLNADEPTIAAGLLHDTVEDTWATVQDIEENFGPDVTQLVDAVTKLSKIEYRSRTQRQVESYRKMLVAMARDLRVILIKLADRLHNMRTLEFLPNAKQVSIARETMDLYAPLAGRLGMHGIRAELEDLSFRYLESDQWAELSEALALRRTADEEAIRETVEALQETVSNCGVEAEISGRQKHLYSIWRKMQKRHVELDQVYDMIAFRIIVPEVRDCYTVLGEVHTRWTPIPGRIKDYIAMPKANRYQSLHTTVIGPRGKPIEVQIRTVEMHRVAELGVAAHWAYKEGGAADPSRTPFSWLRELYELHGAVRDSEQFVESVRLDIFQDEVYVFTPEGDMIELPSGATPLDFAYKIHTEVGHRTRGAKVNGKMVPLSTPLQTGQIVEILTGKEDAPRRDWLKIARTSAARQKIRAYLNRRDREHALILGRSLLVQAFKELGLEPDPVAWLSTPSGRQALSDLKLRDADHLVEALGYGRLTLPRFKQVIERRAGLRGGHAQTRFLAPLERLWRRSAATRDAPLIVDGQRDIETSIAQCCRPLPGDDVVGYVRVGRGIRIHRADCPRMETANPDRIVPVAWGRTDGSDRQIVQLDLECVDTPGVLARVGHAVSAQKINIVETTFRASGDGRAEGSVKVAVRNRAELDRVIEELGKLRGVTNVRRH